MKRRAAEPEEDDEGEVVGYMRDIEDDGDNGEPVEVERVWLGPLEDGESRTIRSHHHMVGDFDYVVRRSGNLYSCTCPAWLFAHQKEDPSKGFHKTNWGRGRKTCKHLIELRGIDEEMKRMALPPSPGANIATWSDADGHLKSLSHVAVLRFSEMLVRDLRALLKMNDQVTTGNKADLVDRCVDRYLHGNMPRCPECGGGRLQYGRDGYYCPGFWNAGESNFEPCFYTSNAPIKRSPWREPIKSLRKLTSGVVLPAIRIADQSA